MRAPLGLDECSNETDDHAEDATEDICLHGFAGGEKHFDGHVGG